MKEGSACQSAGAISLSYTGVLGHGRIVAGELLAPSAIETWCPQDLVDPLVVGSGGMHGVLSSIPHGIGLVFAGVIRGVRSGQTQNSSGTLYPPSQTADGPNQGCNHIVNTII